MNLNPLEIFKKKNTLNIFIFDEAGIIYNRKVTYDNNRFTIKQSGKEYTYYVDPERVYYTEKERRPTSCYWANNPQPMDLNHERNPKLDSLGFTQIIESKVVEDLFAAEAEDKLKWILYICIGNAILMLIVILIETGAIKMNFTGGG